MIGVGTPRALQEIVTHLFSIVLRLISISNATYVPPAHYGLHAQPDSESRRQSVRGELDVRNRQFRHGLLEQTNALIPPPDARFPAIPGGMSDLTGQ